MSSVESVVLNVLAKVGRRVPATKLVKLVYLTDYVNYQHFGETATGLQYQWDHYGPNAVGHEIVRTAEHLADRSHIIYWQEGNAFGAVTKWFSATGTHVGTELDPKVMLVISDVVAQFGALSVKAITAASKKTKPFQDASQYDLLVMEQTVPALRAEPEDVAAFRDDLSQRGTVPHDVLLSRYFE